MRTQAYKDLIAKEADELASDAFDRQQEPIQFWLLAAAREEFSNDARDAVLEVIDAAVVLSLQPTAPERVARLRRAVAGLREQYVEHAGADGLYAAEARDTVDGNLADAAEAAAEFRAECLAEAREAGLRG
jgi:hypothetical protein